MERGDLGMMKPELPGKDNPPDIYIDIYYIEYV